MTTARNELAEQILDKIRKLLNCSAVPGVGGVELLKVDSDTCVHGMLSERVLINFPGFTLSLGITTIWPEKKNES